MNMSIPKHIKKNIVLDVDGFYYYWPDGNGHYAPHHLREIADELDRMNEPWEKQIEEYFNNSKPKDD